MIFSKKILVAMNWYFFYSLRVINCSTINDTNVLLHDLLNGYNTRIKPVADQDEQIIVNVSILLKSIQQLDEVHGIFTIFAGLYIKWVDERMIWNSSQYGGIKEVDTVYGDVWVPELILTSPADDADSLGKKWQNIKFTSNGNAIWISGTRFKSTCAVNMKNYPFDKQVCKVSFMAWGLSQSQIKLQGLTMDLELTYFEENNIWTLIEILKNVPENNTVNLLFHLERKSAFIVINLILPLTLLKFLNAFVFLLKPESGERISYCLTVLLSISVFMTIVSDTLPKSSEPVPTISYKVLFDLINSASIALVTIFNLRLFHKAGMVKVPRCLRKLLIKFAIDVRRGKKGNVAPNDEVPPSRKAKPSREMDDTEVHDIDELSDVVPEVVLRGEDMMMSWQRVSMIIDYTAFVIFACNSILSFVIFLFLVQ